MILSFSAEVVFFINCRIDRKSFTDFPEAAKGHFLLTRTFWYQIYPRKVYSFLVLFIIQGSVWFDNWQINKLGRSILAINDNLIVILSS